MMTQLWDRIVAATKTRKYLCVPIDSGPALASDASYVRIFIAEMHLQSKFSWFNGVYPAVQAAVKLKFGDQAETVITRVVKPPENATVDAVLKNHEILPLTPFNGGTLELQAALLSLKGENYLGSAIKVLQDFSSLVAVPLGQALAIAEKVSNGLESIVDATHGSAVLGYSEAFVGAGMGQQTSDPDKPSGPGELRPGYIALVRAEAGEMEAAQLSVANGELRYRGQELRGFDFILLRIDGPAQRDDYMQLTSLRSPYEEFLKALEEGADDTAIATSERRLKTAIFRCGDLARFDRARVWDAIGKEIADVKAAYGKGARGTPPRSMNDIIGTWGVPMEQAMALADQGSEFD